MGPTDHHAPAHDIVPAGLMEAWPMSLARPVAFWIAVFASIIVAIVLLREVLLPFVAGMVLAYVLDPRATRLERQGMSGLIATLTIVGAFVVGVAALVILSAPVVAGALHCRRPATVPRTAAVD
jgi:predicted PurR-regulated permease PerM